MDPRKATISLQYNGANASGQIGSDLSAFQYKDVASGTSDSIGLDLNDRDHRWIGAWFPQKGDLLQPTIQTRNWTGDGQQLNFPCGTFRVDDFSFSGGPIRLHLDAVAVPAENSGFKATERTETYETTTLKEIGQTITGRSGISLFFEAPDVAIEKVEQSKQNDCAFYTDLVEKYGLAIKIYNDNGRRPRCRPPQGRHWHSGNGQAGRHPEQGDRRHRGRLRGQQRQTGQRPLHQDEPADLITGSRKQRSGCALHPLPLCPSSAREGAYSGRQLGGG